jgi:hypothetical protein
MGDELIGTGRDEANRRLLSGRRQCQKVLQSFLRVYSYVLYNPDNKGRSFPHYHK